MNDIIDALGAEITSLLGCGYAGQEPQDKDGIPQNGLVVIERIGGQMSLRGRSDSPWIQFTVLGASKKKAWDQLRQVREFFACPRVKVGSFFVYGVEEVIAPTEASLAADPFYRVRCSFRFHVKGLA